MTCCLTVLPVPAICDLNDCNTCLILDETRVYFITLVSLAYLSSHCMCLYLLLEPVTRSLARMTVYCINWKLLLCLTWCRLEVYPTTFLLTLSSKLHGELIESSQQGLGRGNWQTMGTVPGEFLGIGDSGFPAYSSITILVSVWRSGPARGMFGERDLAF